MSKLDLTSAVMSNVSEATALEYIEFRSTPRSPLGQRAFDRAMREAAKCAELGIEPDEAIELTIDKKWAGVTYAYVAAELTRRQQAMALAYPSTRGGILDKLRDSADFADFIPRAH